MTSMHVFLSTDINTTPKIGIGVALYTLPVSPQDSGSVDRRLSLSLQGNMRNSPSECPPWSTLLKCSNVKNNSAFSHSYSIFSPSGHSGRCATSSLSYCAMIPSDLCILSFHSFLRQHLFTTTQLFGSVTQV